MKEEYYQIQAFQNGWEACSEKYDSLPEAIHNLKLLQPTVPNTKLEIVKVIKTTIKLEGIK